MRLATVVHLSWLTAGVVGCGSRASPPPPRDAGLTGGGPVDEQAAGVVDARIADAAAPPPADAASFDAAPSPTPPLGGPPRLEPVQAPVPDPQADACQGTRRCHRSAVTTLDDPDRLVYSSDLGHVLYFRRPAGFVGYRVMLGRPASASFLDPAALTLGRDWTVVDLNERTQEDGPSTSSYIVCSPGKRPRCAFLDSHCPSGEPPATPTVRREGRKLVVSRCGVRSPLR